MGGWVYNEYVKGKRPLTTKALVSGRTLTRAQRKGHHPMTVTMKAYTDLAGITSTIEQHGIVSIGYRGEGGNETYRTVRIERVWTCNGKRMFTGYCELRMAIRTFACEQCFYAAPYTEAANETFGPAETPAVVERLPGMSVAWAFDLTAAQVAKAG